MACAPGSQKGGSMCGGFDHHGTHNDPSPVCRPKRINRSIGGSGPLECLLRVLHCGRKTPVKLMNPRWYLQNVSSELLPRLPSSLPWPGVALHIHPQPWYVPQSSHFFSTSRYQLTGARLSYVRYRSRTNSVESHSPARYWEYASA